MKLGKKFRCIYIKPHYAYLSLTLSWPAKMSLFSFGKNFYKTKGTFKIFSPQILEVYRILLAQTNLKSIMFYYTFSVANDMFDPGTHSSNWNIKIVHNSIELFLWNPSELSSDVVFKDLCCLWIVFINSVFKVPQLKIAWRLTS